MKQIKTEEELSNSIKKNDVVVAKFGAEWCGPCRVLEKNIDEIEKENSDTAEFVEIDVDDADEEFVDKYYLRGLPVTYFFKEGEKAYVVEGLMTKEQILERIEILKTVESVDMLKRE
jgi:thioredoxin 1